MSWRNCNASEVLLDGVNKRWPNRDTASDGTIGDPAHASRLSDHNPDRRFTPGVVKARDIDVDGILAAPLAEHIRALGSKGFAALRGGYIIFNRRIAGTHTGWVWREYNGVNPHTTHMHISFADEQVNFDSTVSWAIHHVGPPPPSHSHPMPTLRQGDSGSSVYDLQGHIRAWRNFRKMSLPVRDGQFGPGTKSAVQTIQRAYRLSPDGVVGPQTWRIIHAHSNGKIL